MVTKFITNRICIPVLDLFRKKDTTHETEQELSARTAEIKARIATLRSSLGESTKPVEAPQTQPKHVVAEESQQSPRDTNREKRTQDLNDLKAKLMKKKK